MPFSHHRNALVIDDEPLICWALAKELTSLNFTVRCALSGRDALALLRDCPLDIVFLDVHLPDTDGIDLSEEVGRVSPTSRIIIMSADASEGNRRRALARGASQFIEKPFSVADIQNVLRSLIGDFHPKRRHPRYYCRLPVRISVVGPAAECCDYDLHNLKGQTADMGAGGIRIQTEYPLQVGQSVRTRLDAASDPFAAFIPPDGMAEVVWVVPAAEAVTAGLRFLA